MESDAEEASVRGKVKNVIYCAPCNRTPGQRITRRQGGYGEADKVSQGRRPCSNFDLTIAFLIAIIILFLPPAAFADGAGSMDDDNSRDVYQVQGKVIVIYSDDAIYAGDDELDNKKNAAPVQSNNLLKNFGARSNENPVNIEADSMDYDNVRDVYHAKGKVNITYSGAALSADDVELDNKNNVATAQGNAFLKTGEDTLQGEKIVLNIEDKTGAAYMAHAFYAMNNFYVNGDKIEKTGENTYLIEQPVATTCDGDKPDWAIAGSEMKVTMEGYGLMKDAQFLVKGLPAFYSPYLPFPAKSERQSGFLIPYLSSSNNDGIDIEVPYFWAISPQMDATFYQNYIEKRGFQEGAEYRYYLGNNSFGTFYGDYIEDTEHVTETTYEATNRDWQEMHKRWSYYFNSQTNFDPQFYVRTDIIDISDKWYFQDFSAHNYFFNNYAETTGDSFKNVPFKADQTLRYLESTVRVFKEWSNYSLTGLIDTTEDYNAVINDQTLQRYPEIVLAGSKQQFMNTPLYYDFTGTYDYFYSGAGQKGHYIDFSPTVSMPFNISNYLKVTPQFSLKETSWDRDDNQTGSGSKSGDTTIYNALLSLSSQASRVFDINLGNWEKISHEIKPEIIYSYVPNVSQGNMPDYYLPAFSPFIMPGTTPITTASGKAFEGIVGTFSSLPVTIASYGLEGQNAVAWSLTNTLTAKVKDDTGAYSYLEFLRFKLFQTYDINEANKNMEGITQERMPFSDIGMEFDFTPHKYFSFMVRNLYNVYGGWDQSSYDLNVKDWRGDSLSIGYRYTVNSVEEIDFNLKALIAKNIDATFISRYDLFNSQTVENTLGFVYHKQCWSMGLDFTQTSTYTGFSLKFSLAGFDKSVIK
ncbi:MAG: LPS-assembly protein LptD [Smithella sp.]